MTEKKRIILNQEIVESFISDPLYIHDLLYCREWKSFFLYEDGYYKELTEDEDMPILLNKYIKAYFPEVNIREGFIFDIIAQITWSVYRKVDTITSNFIALNDKVLDMNDFTLKDFNRKIVVIHKLDIDSADLKSPIPEWEKYLRTTLVDKNGNTDMELIELVQSMFGFYLLNELEPHATFFLVGQGLNGKSVLINTLSMMFGEKFMTAMSVEYLTKNEWAMASLAGKKLNVCSEEESKFVKSDKFKALVSGDRVQANRKYLKPITFSPQVKYLFATNEMPTFEGLNMGLRRRINIIPFNKQFGKEDRDKQLTNKLKLEIGGIINWAMDGAKKFMAADYEFPYSTQAEEAKAEFEELVSGAISFFNELYITTPDRIDFYPHQQLYDQYVIWAKANGRKTMKSTSFSKDLRNNCKGILEGKARVGGVPKSGFWLEKKPEEECDIEIISDIDDLIKNQQF